MGSNRESVGAMFAHFSVKKKRGGREWQIAGGGVCRTFLPRGPWKNIWVMEERDPHTAAYKSVIVIFCLQLCFSDTHTHTHGILFLPMNSRTANQTLLAAVDLRSTSAVPAVPTENSRALKTLRPQLESWGGGGESITVHLIRPKWLKRCDEWAHVEQSSLEVMGNGKFMNFNWLLKWIESEWTWPRPWQSFMTKEAIKLGRCP